jgi:diguanylate cyclase (GGDEF)-like protein/PAS domain S-box-containing protein
LRLITPTAPSREFELFSQRHDGSTVWHHLWHVYGMFDESGNLHSLQLIGTDITQWKNAESALRRSQRDLAAAQRIAHLGSWVWTLATGEMEWSEELYRIFGHPPAAIRPDCSLFLRSAVPEDRGEMERALHQAMAGAAPFSKEFRIVRPDGTERHLSVQAEIRFRADGRPAEVVGTALDISERARAETELRRSKEFLDHVLDAIEDDVFVKDQAHAWVILNDAACRQIGGRREDLVGKSDFGFFPEHHARQHWETDEQVLRSGETLSYQWTTDDGGNRRTFSTKKSLFADSATGKKYIAGVARDITDLKEIETALFEEKERALVTLHSIGDGVITTNANTGIEYMNPVAERLTGWSGDQALGRPLASVFTIIEETSGRPLLDPGGPDPQSRTGAWPLSPAVLVHRSGREYAIEHSASPIRGRDGKFRGAVLVFRDVTERRRMARQLEHDATHDPLTGLINRREFERRLENAVMSARRSGAQHVLCYLDLDQFKLVNDTVGHVAGDELLRQVQGLLVGSFRERDTFARLGGDEFGLLLNNCPAEEALAIAEIIVSTFREFQFQWEGRSFQVGASIGVVPITAAIGSATEALSQADVACYAAKDQGGAQVHVYRNDGSTKSRSHHQMILASGLRSALESNGFCLYRQPVFEVSRRGDVPVQYEILLRLKDGDRIVLPEEFIVPAERYGLMAAIDRWVIREAVTFLKESDGGAGGLEFAINLSGNSLNDDGLLEFLDVHVIDAAAVPARICFEITETAAIRNIGKTVLALEEIKLRGFRLALDDFGSGLSSFKYLKCLPVDYLKIDGSFVQEMAENPVDLHMVEAINEVAHVLGMRTIAECVEDARALDYLSDLGVDMAQGFALGVPAPLTAGSCREPAGQISEPCQ